MAPPNKRHRPSAASSSSSNTRYINNNQPSTSYAYSSSSSSKPTTLNSISTSNSEPNSVFYLKAHEVTLIKGHSELAESVQSKSNTNTSSNAKGKGRMIKWNGRIEENNSASGIRNGIVSGGFLVDDDDDDDFQEEGGNRITFGNVGRDYEGDVRSHEAENEDDGIWVDRYDALNLLSTLPQSLCLFKPSSKINIQSKPLFSDPIGLENLPSDSEEMFYFTSDERVEIERERKRRRLELGREERMRVLEEQEKNDGDGDDEDDAEEKPSETQLALMKKLHQTLLNSSEPRLLEMRILANHGGGSNSSNNTGDGGAGKFDFLRKGGKFEEVWKKIRDGSWVDEADEKRSDRKQEANENGGGLVNGYGSDSDSEEGTEMKAGEDAKSEEKKEETNDVERTELGEGKQVEEETEEEKEKKLKKLEKAKEWARKRKEAREKEEAEKASAIS